MMKRFGCFPLLAVLAGIGLVIALVQVYGGKFLDRYQRPWAYSQTKSLLVGHWKGQFRDPDGIPKTIDLEIFLPETDNDRWAKVGKRRRKSGFGSDNRSFDGVASVTSRLGRETYDVYGAIDREIDSRFSLHVQTRDGKYPFTPNFYVNDTRKQDNSWTGDQLKLTLLFAYHRPGGSSYSSSADPRFGRVAPLTLTRYVP